jgi:chromosome segregation ATPase
MSVAGKHSEVGDPGNSFAATGFRKALKGFESGDLPYSEVQSELKRLLAGVSRRELHEVLRRSESIEPLPEYAYREVRRFLDETIEQGVAPQTDPGGIGEHDEQLDPAALTAELQKSREALESERTRVREAEEALSERIAAEEAVRSRLGIALHESERHQAELRAARNSIASRDKVTAQIRQTLDERDAQLAAIRREHAELAAALDLHSASGGQLDADLQVLRGQAADVATELAASREALDKERRKRQDIERALTESNSLNSAARASLASKDKALAEMRQTLDEHGAQLAAMRREHAELAAAAAAELAGSRDAADEERRKRQEIERSLTESNSLNSAARESLASKEKALAEMRRTLDERDAQLVAAHGRVLGANTDLDGLRAEVANLQARLRDNDGLVETLSASVRSEAERATQWRAAAQQRESEATVTSVRAIAMPREEVPTRAHLRWNIRTAPRQLWIGAAIVVFATVIWFAAHRPSPMASTPAASSAAMIQPAATALATESANPESVSTENAAAIEAPSHGAAISDAGKPVTAGVRLNTDFGRCRAGGLDACYDAIRYRPSDPSLLSALGDALLRANRPADALRAYQRVAILAPNMPGVVAKISALEAKLSAAKLSAKRASGGASAHAADAMRNSNVAPQTQSH